MSEETTLARLNAKYIESYMTADTDWYDRHLTEDFVCIRSDGSVLDKSQFLRDTAEGPDVTEYRLEHVKIRLLGQTALVHGTGLFTRQDGTQGTSVYTDVYTRIGDEWKVVAAQITRTAAAKQPAG